MKKLIRRLWGAPPQALPAASAPTRDDNPLTIEDGSDNAVRRQLVQVLLRDLLRKHGIAPHWIELQMLLVSSRRGTGLYVRLIVRQWDERLMNYACALQNTLLADIARFEPQASNWLHGISWQLEMADSCPYTTLPDKAFWLAAAKPTAAAPLASSPADPALQPKQAFESLVFDPTTPAARSSEEGDALEDLQRLFNIRDQELAKHPVAMAVGYEPTQPLRL